MNSSTTPCVNLEQLVDGELPAAAAASYAVAAVYTDASAAARRAADAIGDSPASSERTACANERRLLFALATRETKQ